VKRALALLALAACSGASEDSGSTGEDALTVPPPGCAASANASNPNFEFQDDVCKRKVFPSDADRDFACGIHTEEIPASYEPPKPLADVRVDTTTFADIPAELDLAIIDVRRDASGTPHYRYFSNGTHDRAFQPLSSTKFMAVANGARALRAKSNGAVGLPATASGMPLGDFVTIIHNYNEQHYESNALARWFENVGGRQNAQDLVHEWLGRPGNESFGGNYGVAAPHIAYSFSMPDGASVDVTPDDPAQAPANNLSALTMAEFLKRLVMHREDASTRLASVQWEDLRVLFYGSAQKHWTLPSESGVVPAAGFGGMSADAAIYLQSAVDIHAIESESHGKWRIFSKLGYGESGLVENGYACLPGIGELFVSTHFAQPDANPANARKRDAKIAAYYKLIVGRLAHH
jgi:hypothetical protein